MSFVKKHASGFVGRGKLLAGAGALGLTLIGASNAQAGYRSGAYEVTISGTTSGYFAGSLASSRASSDGTQYIGCQIEWVGPNANTTATNTPVNYGYCFARDRNGNTKSCYVTIKGGGPAATLSNITPNSYISVNYFTMPDVAYCGQIDIYNISYLPVMAN